MYTYGVIIEVCARARLLAAAPHTSGVTVFRSRNARVIGEGSGTRAHEIVCNRLPGMCFFFWVGSIITPEKLTINDRRRGKQKKKS